jgi:thiamine phosphate synthase YjbQ (UPF0047 family)
MRELIRFATRRSKELVGPSETIPQIGGRLGLSRWQNLFFFEFDGPRSQRSVVVTVLADH